MASGPVLHPGCRKIGWQVRRAPATFYRFEPEAPIERRCTFVRVQHIKHKHLTGRGGKQLLRDGLGEQGVEYPASAQVWARGTVGEQRLTARWSGDLGFQNKPPSNQAGGAACSKMLHEVAHRVEIIKPIFSAILNCEHSDWLAVECRDEMALPRESPGCGGDGPAQEGFTLSGRYTK